MKRSTKRRREAALGKTCDQPSFADAKRHVSRQQTRIASMINKGDLDKASRATTRLLKSYHLRTAAVLTVTQGVQTPGPDGKTYNSCKKKLSLAESIDLFKEYGPTRPVEILKEDGVSIRTIEISNLEDRAREKMFEMVLAPWIEHHLSPRQFGFRPGRGTQDAIAYARILSMSGSHSFAKMDVRKLFDEIPHPVITERLKSIGIQGTVLRATQKWLRDRGGKEQVGIPQGSPFSPCLANLVLAGLAEELSASGTGHPIIYADDIIVLAKTEEQAERAVENTRKYLENIGLSLNEKKLSIGTLRPRGDSNSRETFEFLGVEFKLVWTIKEGTRVPYPMCTPSKAAQAKLRARIKDIIKNTRVNGKHRQALRNVRRNGREPVTAMTIKLNRVLRGWGNYYRHTNAKRIFSDLDHFVFMTLLRWAKRNFKNKSAQWIKDRCFSGVSTDQSGTPLKRKNGTPRERDWIFTSPFTPDQTPKRTVIKLSDLSVDTYKKMIKFDVSYFSGNWIYWNLKSTTRYPGTPRDIAPVAISRQNGKCHSCDQDLKPDRPSIVTHRGDKGRQLLSHTHCHNPNR